MYKLTQFPNNSAIYVRFTQRKTLTYDDLVQVVVEDNRNISTTGNHTEWNTLHYCTISLPGMQKEVYI